MRRHQVQSIQHSIQHSVLCLFQVGLTVLGRPFGEVDRLIRWPEGEGVGIREWGVGRMPTAYFLKPRHGVRHIIATEMKPDPMPGRTGGTPIPTWREWYSRAVWG